MACRRSVQIKLNVLRIYEMLLGQQRVRPAPCSASDGAIGDTVSKDHKSLFTFCSSSFLLLTKALMLVELRMLGGKPNLVWVCKAGEGARVTQGLLTPWQPHKKWHEPPGGSSFPDVFPILVQNTVKTSSAVILLNLYLLYSFLPAPELTWNQNFKGFCSGFRNRNWKAWRSLDLRLCSWHIINFKIVFPASVGFPFPVEDHLPLTEWWIIVVEWGREICRYQI